ncbi:MULTISPECIES: putative quinol monooxygenase [Basfia]|uniref:ABM domain-containing protein n=1 Tax=Mannheimia succiniciproducens (strain KCTC 0769BP / MBEL55E) TaxID=221988 RepID=Q65QU1_MANSM|nr:MULTISPECIES: putative quinol monooxygenase [Basfia]AAU38669.1 unknown [[Mannheimia] succiniciproducens MBEL55E]SEP56083.1 Quinol monooxygenase YgiN [Basfia succiniciproducens]
MIAVYAIAKVKADKITAFEDVVKELVAKSRGDQGCISYACGSVQGKENTYTFIEQWQSMEDLKLHTQQPHFIEAGAKFADILSAELEINVVDYLA